MHTGNSALLGAEHSCNSCRTGAVYVLLRCYTTRLHLATGSPPRAASAARPALSCCQPAGIRSRSECFSACRGWEKCCRGAGRAAGRRGGLPRRHCAAAPGARGGLGSSLAVAEGAAGPSGAVQGRSAAAAGLSPLPHHTRPLSSSPRSWPASLCPRRRSQPAYCSKKSANGRFAAGASTQQPAHARRLLPRAEAEESPCCLIPYAASPPHSIAFAVAFPSNIAPAP